MDEKKRCDDGMARRRKVLGNEWVDRANAGKTTFNEEFQELKNSILDFVALGPHSRLRCRFGGLRHCPSKPWRRRVRGNERGVDG